MKEALAVEPDHQIDRKSTFRLESGGRSEEDALRLSCDQNEGRFFFTTLSTKTSLTVFASFLWMDECESLIRASGRKPV